MKIITLMEDTMGASKVKAEHGLSFYIETKRHRLLMDTGASPFTWDNAEKLGVDISKVDVVIISHGHYDHTGGLMEFAGGNPMADIYMQKSAGREYFHGDRYIGIDKKIMDLPRLHLLDGDYRIDDELHLFSGITGRILWPQSNLFLSERVGDTLIQDQFLHEQCLVICNGDEKILVSGCAHNGILNILSRFKSIYHCYPGIVISGFHMMKKTGYTEVETDNIKNTAYELGKLPIEYYTGHCTGQAAFDIMKSIMGEKLHQIHSGDIIEKVEGSGYYAGDKMPELRKGFCC